MDNAKLYAERKSNDTVVITRSQKAIDQLFKRLEELFNSLVEKSRPKGVDKVITMKKFELLWKEKEQKVYKDADNDVLIKDFFLGELLGNNDKLDEDFSEPVFIYDVNSKELKEQKS